MKRVVKFTELSEAQDFVKSNPDYRITMVVTCGQSRSSHEEKFFVAYNRKKCPPLNNALIEHWRQEGLI